MRPADLSHLTERILDRCKCARPGAPPTDRQIADAIGVDKSLVSRYRSGGRKLPLDELAALVQEFGAQAVLGPLAELDGSEVRPLATAPVLAGNSPVTAAVRASAEVARFAADVEAALRDGLVSDEEADALQRQHDQAQAQLHQSERALQALLISRRRRPA